MATSAASGFQPSFWILPLSRASPDSKAARSAAGGGTPGGGTERTSATSGSAAASDTARKRILFMEENDIAERGNVRAAVWRSVRHGVDDVIHADADSEIGKLGGIFRIVGVLPGVAQVHVVADGHHEPAFIVVDAAPARYNAVILPQLVAADVLVARHLVALVQIVECVKDLVGGLAVDDGTVRKNALHAIGEHFPLISAVEVVAHEEAAAQKVFAHLGGLRISEIPVANLDAVEKRVPKHFVAFV